MRLPIALHSSTRTEKVQNGVHSLNLLMAQLLGHRSEIVVEPIKDRLSELGAIVGHVVRRFQNEVPLIRRWRAEHVEHRIAANVMRHVLVDYARAHKQSIGTAD